MNDDCDAKTANQNAVNAWMNCGTHSKVCTQSRECANILQGCIFAWNFRFFFRCYELWWQRQWQMWEKKQKSDLKQSQTESRIDEIVSHRRIVRCSQLKLRLKFVTAKSTKLESDRDDMKVTWDKERERERCVNAILGSNQNRLAWNVRSLSFSRYQFTISFR